MPQITHPYGSCFKAKAASTPTAIVINNNNVTSGVFRCFVSGFAKVAIRQLRVSFSIQILYIQYTVLHLL